MKVWVVIGRIDYEGAEIEAVSATYEDAWVAMLGCVKAWDAVAIEVWEVGDKLAPKERHVGAGRVRAEARTELELVDHPSWTVGPPWRELARSDGSVVVREYT